MMDLIVKNANTALWGDAHFSCAVGRGGVIAADIKCEGDGATPAGRWIMREVLYRSDRIKKPETALSMRALDPNDGWCEQPNDPNYNKLVRHPYPVALDRMWRDDHLYNIVVVLGYNDAPVKPGKGSAIFLHLARPDFSPSAGCVTLQQDDLLKVLREADATSCVDIRLP